MTQEPNPAYKRICYANGSIPGLHLKSGRVWSGRVGSAVCLRVGSVVLADRVSLFKLEVDQVVSGSLMNPS